MARPGAGASVLAAQHSEMRGSSSRRARRERDHGHRQVRVTQIHPEPRTHRAWRSCWAQSWAWSTSGPASQPLRGAWAPRRLRRGSHSSSLWLASLAAGSKAVLGVLACEMAEMSMLATCSRERLACEHGCCDSQKRIFSGDCLHSCGLCRAAFAVKARDELQSRARWISEARTTDQC